MGASRRWPRHVHPALDAISRLLPASHRLADLHADLIAADGSWLRTTDGQHIAVPEPMWPSLARQRTAMTLAAARAHRRC